MLRKPKRFLRKCGNCSISFPFFISTIKETNSTSSSAKSTEHNQRKHKINCVSFRFDSDCLAEGRMFRWNKRKMDVFRMQLCVYVRCNVHSFGSGESFVSVGVEALQVVMVFVCVCWSVYALCEGHTQIQGEKRGRERKSSIFHCHWILRLKILHSVGSKFFAHQLCMRVYVLRHQYRWNQ